MCQGGTKEHQTKQSDVTRGIAYHQNVLEEGKLVDGVACVVCIVSHRHPIFMIFGIMQKYCRGYWFFQILPCILPSVELVLQVW